MPTLPLQRRTFLRTTGSAAAAAAVGSPTVAACQRSTVSNSRAANEKVRLPSYRPYHGVRPDLPATKDGVQAAFLRYPAHPVSCVDGKPASGGSISMLGAVNGAVPPGLPHNAFWQSLNAALGTELKMQSVPAADLPVRLAVTLAGDDLPDVLQLPSTVPNTPQLLNKRFQDLTEFLSGEAVADFPLLGTYSPEQWRTTVYNGGIYGLPIPREPVGGIMYRRDDIFRAKGVEMQPATFADFQRVCAELTDRRGRRWATSNWHGLLSFVQEMLGAPNGWRERHGTFRSEYEDPSFVEALAAVRGLVAAGYTHPDTFATAPSLKDWFGGGITAMNFDGYTAWHTYVATYSGAVPELSIGAMLPPPFAAGTTPGIRRGEPSYSTTVFKKAAKSRIRELLRVANYLAAPFGTSEYLVKKYGAPGSGYSIVNGDVAQTARSEVECLLPMVYYACERWAIYTPNRPADTRRLHAYEERAVPMTVADPSVGLFSNAAQTQGPAAAKLVNGAIADILQGRRAVSSWDEVVRQWRQQGGDAIRSEYETAFAERH